MPKMVLVYINTVNFAMAIIIFELFHLTKRPTIQHSVAKFYEHILKAIKHLCENYTINWNKSYDFIVMEQ